MTKIRTEYMKMKHNNIEICLIKVLKLINDFVLLIFCLIKNRLIKEFMELT